MHQDYLSNHSIVLHTTHGTIFKPITLWNVQRKYHTGGKLLDACSAEQSICHVYCVVARQDYVLDINLGVTPTASFCAECRGSRLYLLFPPLFSRISSKL